MVPSKEKGKFRLSKFGHDFIVAFDTKTGITTAVLMWNGRKQIKNIGKARCSKEDKFNVKYGAALAIKRALFIANSAAVAEANRELLSYKSVRENEDRVMNERLEKILKEESN